MAHTPRSPAPAEAFRITMSLKPLSPKGDLSARDDEPFHKGFRRKIKSAGKSEHAGTHLPYHPEPMQSDTPGLSVRTAPKDEVS